MPVVSQMSTRKIEVTSVFDFPRILAEFQISVTKVTEVNGVTEVTEVTYNCY